MVPGASAPKYCSTCGSYLAAGARFCSQCGSPVDERAERRTRDRRDGSSSNSGSEWLRRRVNDYAVEGWEVERDFGDRVVLVKRGFGSIAFHVVLLLFTSGVGNLLYAWYSHTVGASRVEIREDGTERWVGSGEESDSAFPVDIAVVAGAVFGALLVGAIAFALATGAFGPAAAFALLLVVTGYLTYALAEPDLGFRRSLTTFGRVRSTDEEWETDGGARCTACDGPAAGGVTRTYAERFYVAGVPVATYHEGENQYCADCAEDGRSGRGTGVEFESDAERDFA